MKKCQARQYLIFTVVYLIMIIDLVMIIINLVKQEFFMQQVLKQYESSLEWTDGTGTAVKFFNVTGVESGLVNETNGSSVSTWIHEGFESHKRPKLLLDDLPSMTEFEYETDIYCAGLPSAANNNGIKKHASKI